MNLTKINFLLYLLFTSHVYAMDNTDTSYISKDSCIVSKVIQNQNNQDTVTVYTYDNGDILSYEQHSGPHYDGAYCSIRFQHAQAEKSEEVCDGITYCELTSTVDYIIGLSKKSEQYSETFMNQQEYKQHCETLKNSKVQPIANPTHKRKLMILEDDNIPFTVSNLYYRLQQRDSKYPFTSHVYAMDNTNTSYISKDNCIASKVIQDQKAASTQYKKSASTQTETDSLQVAYNQLKAENENLKSLLAQQVKNKNDQA